MGMMKSVLRHVRGLLTVLCLGVGAQTATAQSLEDQYKLLRQTLITSFSQQKLVPVITSRGERVGDIYDIGDLTLIGRASDCFPKLVQPKAETASLPQVVNLGELDISLAVGAPELGSVRGDLGGARAIEIRYSQPTVQVVSVMQLQKAFSAKKCEALEPVVMGRYVKAASHSWPLVVAEVYYAKREVTISAGDKASGEVSISGLSALLRKLKLSIAADAGANYKQDKRILLTSTEPVVVAVRPAFLPRKFMGLTMGIENVGGTSGIQGVQWASFEPAVKPSQNALFDQLVAAGACTSIACFNRTP